MPEIIGIACVYGVAVSKDLIDAEDMNLHGSGLSVYTHPDWEDMVILGTTVVTLDVDPSLTGSTMAPVITIPDVFDFSNYSEERPMYYQVPIMEI
jgi:hypothetical protein